MPMRGAVRRARPQASVELRQFGWDRALVATLRHSTLPWTETLDPAPLVECDDLGARDKLSLVAQFAAHQAFLQFAGVGDGECDPAEWAVARKRGSDCRLIRVASRAPAADGPPALTIIQQFAEAIGVRDVDTLRHSWGRAEMVYQEVDARLRAGAAADLRWMRRAAWGEIAAPGAEALRELFVTLNGRWRISDAAAVRAAAALGGGRVVEIGGDASPLQRYSAIAALQPDPSASESAVVERVLDAASRRRFVFIVAGRERFDAASRRVIEMLEASDAGTWISDDGGLELPPARFFVVSPVLTARRQIERRGREWIATFVESPAFARYLADGTVPPPESDMPEVGEPLRSYLGAIALLGARVRRDVAARFLARLGFAGRVEELFGEEEIVLASREAALRAIPQASRIALARVAAEVLEASADLRGAAAVLIDAGDASAGAALLERVDLGGDAIAVLSALPRPALTPRLAETLARALIDAARYRDAREIAALLEGDRRELLLARAERRTGDYATALARLERLQSPSDESELLRADLFFLLDRFDEMPDCGDDVQARYLRALKDDAFDTALPADHYLAARLATYAALHRHEHAAAAEAATLSLSRATTVVERIDAALDRVFVLFMSGAWR